MAALRSELLRELTARGFVHQATDLEALDQLAAREPVTAYIGYDCTGDSLHIGHQLSVMVLFWLQRFGHRPIALLGGGTTKVGDPSGKDESRQLLDQATIDHNKAGVLRSLQGFLDFDDGQAILADNADWLDQLRYVPLLRDYGRHFTINRMLTFDSVRLRLEREQPLTFLEFNYMVMQAYDFVELARRYGCRLQCGGSDQWGNIVNGVELGRRVESLQLFGLTTPLITTASGAKMGKTAQGAVWLNEDRLGHFDYWQFWRNTEDADVGRFLRLFTDLPLSEIARLEALAGGELNEAKQILADAATRLCRGPAAAAAGREAAAAAFGGAGDLSRLPTTAVPAAELAAGVPVLDLFRRAGLGETNGEVRRLIRGGGARLNDERLDDEALVVTTRDLQDGQIRLAAGKKRHARIVSG